MLLVAREATFAPYWTNPRSACSRPVSYEKRRGLINAAFFSCQTFCRSLRRRCMYRWGLLKRT
jgi:hypothetical protein